MINLINAINHLNSWKLPQTKARTLFIDTHMHIFFLELKNNYLEQYFRMFHSDSVYLFIREVFFN